MARLYIGRKQKPKRLPCVYLLCQSPGTGWRIKIDYTATVVESEVHKAERGVKISENSDDPCVLAEEKEVGKREHLPRHGLRLLLH